MNNEQADEELDRILEECQGYIDDEEVKARARADAKVAIESHIAKHYIPIEQDKQDLDQIFEEDDSWRSKNAQYFDPDILKSKILVWRDQHTKAAVAKAEAQTAMNMGVRLRDEFIRRDLTTDNLPKGYRKLTNDELIAKVVTEMMPAELAAAAQKDTK